MVNLHWLLPERAPPLNWKDLRLTAGVITPPHVPTDGLAGFASSMWFGRVSVKVIPLTGDDSVFTRVIVIVEAVSPVTRMGSNFLLMRKSGDPTVISSLASCQFCVSVIPPTL